MEDEDDHAKTDERVRLHDSARLIYVHTLVHMYVVIRH